MEEDWQRDLEHWLEPYLEDLGNKTRRRMCPAYIAGLIGSGDRKSIQLMAARADALSYDRLHHFIGAGLWDSAPLEATLWRQADALVGGHKAWLIIDDTALPKKGKASVGVAPQYATVLGKNANCQTLVSVTLASGEVPVMLGLRLFLPESWTSDAARRPWLAYLSLSRCIEPSPTSPSRRSTALSLLACALDACWPMPATACRHRSGRRSAREACAGPSAFPAIKRSIPPTCS